MVVIRKRQMPLASQLIHEIANGISQGTLVDDNGRLPSEADLCRQFDVSRSTVREALAQLERAGVITRRHGVGTFVRKTFRQNPGTIWGWLDEAPAFVDLISQSGHQAKCELLSVKMGIAGKFAGLIEIGFDTPVVHIEKLFYADNDPVIYSSTVLPFEMISGNPDAASLKREVFEKSIYEIFQEYGENQIDHQSSEIKATKANDRLSFCLQIEFGDPLLEVEEVGYALGQAPLFHALHYFRSDRIRFRQIRVPKFVINSKI